MMKQIGLIILSCLLHSVAAYSACPSLPDGIYDEDRRMTEMRSRVGAPIPVLTVGGGEICLSTGGFGGGLKNKGVTSDFGVTCYGGSHNFPKKCVSLRTAGKVLDAMIVHTEIFDSSDGMDGATAELFDEGYTSMAHYLVIEAGKLASRFYSCKSLADCHTCQEDPSGAQACSNRVARTIGYNNGQSPFFFWRARP